MRIIGAFEAKTHFSALLTEVENGEHVIITKHGRAVAKLIPTTGIDHDRAKKSLDALKEFNKNRKLAGLEWKALRDEGRR